MMLRLVAWRQLAPAMAILAASLAACTALQVQKADSIQAEITKLCGIALPISGAVPSIGVYATAACASEEMIAKLALDPHTIAWLQAIISELKRHA